MYVTSACFLECIPPSPSSTDLFVSRTPDYCAPGDVKRLRTITQRLDGIGWAKAPRDLQLLRETWIVMVGLGTIMCHRVP